ncbi:N/A [soil metagenome]
MRRRDILAALPGGLWAASAVLRAGPAFAQTGPSPTDPVRKVVGNQHFLALLPDGSVLGWGRHREGQLGADAALNTRRRYGVAAPIRIEVPGKVVDIAAGIYSSFFVLDDGTVWSMGRGSDGELGLGAGAMVARLSNGEQGTGTLAQLSGLENIVQVTVDANVGHALSEDGELFSWGSRDSGQVGDGIVAARWSEAVPRSAAPVPATLLAGVRLAKIGGHTAGLAIDENGRVLQWPTPRGPEKSTDIWKPLEPEVLQVPLPAPAVEVTSAGGARLALLRDGTVWAWGWNMQGVWGNGQVADTNDPARWRGTPERVPGVSQATALTAGTFGRHALVLLRDGTLRGWGNSDCGQIGAGVDGEPQPKVVTPRIGSVVRVWAAGNNSFALTRDGRFWSWGGDQSGTGLLGTQAKVPVQWPASLLQPA